MWVFVLNLLFICELMLRFCREFLNSAFFRIIVLLFLVFFLLLLLCEIVFCSFLCIFLV